MATKTVTKTAVQWLIESINKKIDLTTLKYWDEIDAIVQQAKEVEKEQIVDAFDNGTKEWNPIEYSDGQHYYTSTYES
jgi:hypothetical protein